MTYMATRAIFVVGVEHSGTTILYRMLARHPDLAWLSHYSMRDGEIPNRCRVPFFLVDQSIRSQSVPDDLA